MVTSNPGCDCAPEAWEDTAKPVIGEPGPTAPPTCGAMSLGPPGSCWHPVGAGSRAQEGATRGSALRLLSSWFPSRDASPAQLIMWKIGRNCQASAGNKVRAEGYRLSGRAARPGPPLRRPPHPTLGARVPGDGKGGGTALVARPTSPSPAWNSGAKHQCLPPQLCPPEVSLSWRPGGVGDCPSAVSWGSVTEQGALGGT